MTQFVGRDVINKNTTDLAVRCKTESVEFSSVELCRYKHPLKPMTNVPEIGADNPYQKTGTINRHENRTLSYLSPKTGTEKIPMPSCMPADALETGTGIGFQYRFLVRVSLL